jgi:hypothetical protein
MAQHSMEQDGIVQRNKYISVTLVNIENGMAEHNHV